MFLLLLFLTGFGQLHAELNSRRTILHTTVPEKISSPNYKMKAEDDVAYIIKIERKQYLIHLKKQSFLSPGSVVSAYDKKDISHPRSLEAEMDCSYQGYIEDFPNSRVTLNTCSGLRGILQFKNISYGIEPMEAISGFVHMIYEEKNANRNTLIIQDSDISAWSNDLQYKIRKSSKRIEFPKLSPGYIKMFIIVDKNLFNYMGSDINVITQKVILIVGLVNAMLSQLKLTVLVSSIEIWSNKNKISTVGHPDAVLNRLSEWENKYLVFRPHHSTYLFAFRKSPSFIGTTYPGKICYLGFSRGLAWYSDGLSLESFAVSIVQLLGLQLGLNYDSNTDTCLCSSEVCTMTTKALRFGGVKDFSTCSLEELKYVVSQPDLKCLQNRTVEAPAYKSGKKICGNGILETGEECDCGTVKDCTHKKCCDPRTCSKKKGVQCGSGLCCTNSCKIKPRGTVCRPSVDRECDFDEYCNGVSSECVPDTYVRDGYYCESGDSFCFQGKCRGFDRQCKKLVGGASTGAPFYCYEDINAGLDRYGNCGPSTCSLPDMLCGKLICSWPHRRLIIETNLSVLYAHLRDEVCVSAFRAIERPPRADGSVHPGIDTAEERDKTYVEDGSPCGPDMFCHQFQCKETRFFKNSDECDEIKHCNENGICNNFNHCHCKKDTAPPSCNPQKGQFGSIDDGHQMPQGRGFVEGRSATSAKRQLLVMTYTCLPVLIILTTVLIMQTKLRDLWYRLGTESEKSVTEEESSTRSESSLSARSCVQ